MNSDPLVSIVMPIRNEARHIGRCLEAVSAQNYPHERIEILVVDGMSNDGTREIVTRFVERDARVQFLDNPARIAAAGLNRGIRLARGSVAIRVDGHAVIARDYVRRCIDDLAKIEAACVGGPIHTIGETWIARGIAIAQSSPFGVGNAVFRYASQAQYVDTLAFGAYRRNVFEQIGLFDEELVRNQDDEFNYRLTLSGGKLWLDPDIHSDYYSRTSWHGLWDQYLEYGFWKVRVIQKHGRPASWRHLVPGAFVLTLIVSGLVSVVLDRPQIFLTVVAIYVLVSFTASIWLSSRKGFRYLAVLPLAFATMHIAYGVGFLAGLVRFGVGRPVLALPRREDGLDGSGSGGIAD